jgi:hypothetical protein
LSVQTTLHDENYGDENACQSAFHRAEKNEFVFFQMK